MDKAAPAPERADHQEAQTTETPSGWAASQNELAADTGLAMLLVEGRQPPSIIISNNNSICHALQTSAAHAHRCAPFCGAAYDRAMNAGRKTDYRCHAGLHCFTMPVDLGVQKPLAVIGGRAFVRSGDYRALAERIRTGDLADLLSADLFNNVIFAAQQDLDELAIRTSDAAAAFNRTARRKAGGAGERGGDESGGGNASPVAFEEHAANADYSPRLKTFSQGTSLKDTCAAAVKSLVEEQGLNSLALMLRNDESFHTTHATGLFLKKPPRISLKAKEIKLLQSASNRESVVLPNGGRNSSKPEDTVELFPLILGDEVKGVLLVGDKDLSEEQRQYLFSFCRELAMPIEVLRLREELERRMRAATHLQAFSEIINSAQPDEAYATILRHSTELLHAERGSLLLFDEGANELSVKAALGPRADISREARIGIGEGVAGMVLREGRPVVVNDVGTNAQWHPAPAERSYKTNSFISYPISIGGRKVGVLNVTDKAGGGAYDEFDLGLLELIAPQMALALDRAEWHQKATQFQLLSITDPLTNLVNRRYLEERLSEELERSKRHHFEMSFMMVDIDDFKTYNDKNGHQAGDLALEMTSQVLKSALRSADVAARYGGEEFSILLPQTSLPEAKVIAERIRRRVERTHFPHGKMQPLGAVTISIGISSFGLHLDTPASVIYAADQALYVAKSRGKNCVDTFEPVLPPDAESNAR